MDTSTSQNREPRHIGLSGTLSGTCGEDETEAAQSTSRKKRFKKVRFSLHNRVYPISDTEEDPTEGPAEDLPTDEAEERASSLPEVDAETIQNCMYFKVTFLAVKSRVNRSVASDPGFLLGMRVRVW
ncbi:uncharacterized protein LOC144299271 isoform X2 [Canis aureus]